LKDEFIAEILQIKINLY